MAQARYLAEVCRGISITAAPLTFNLMYLWSAAASSITPAHSASQQGLESLSFSQDSTTVARSRFRPAHCNAVAALVQAPAASMLNQELSSSSLAGHRLFNLVQVLAAQAM